MAGRKITAIRETAVLLSLFGLYAAIVLIASSPVLQGDEGGYVENARRLLDGSAVSPQDLRLWWGPGYPLVLLPFLGLGVPWIVAKLLNAVFLIAGIAYFYALLLRYVTPKMALIFTVCLGIYPPLMRELHLLCPESLTLFLVCGFMFHFCRLYNGARRLWLQLLAASAYAAYLALVKVFFGYVIIVGLLLLLLLRLWPRMQRVQHALIVCVLAFLWCIPYLLHTHSLTGKTFYWGTAGGLQLYWMSSPYPAEYGSWFSPKDVKERSELAQHRDFFARLETLPDVERDDALKSRALYNIRHFPRKYLLNWFANVGRLLFSYPFSFGGQTLSTYFYLLPNMFVAVLFTLSMVPAILRPRAIPFELWALLGFTVIAVGGASLLSAYERQFRPLVPALCIWMAFVYARVLRIELRTAAGLTGSHKAVAVDDCDQSQGASSRLPQETVAASL